jgi:hypothetical protein
MAAAEAIRRNHLEDSASYKDASSFFKQVAEIRPKDMPKFRANPGFRRMDDAIQILYKAQVLSCWTVYVRSHLNFRTLEDYARSKPTFENLKKTANEIATRFVAGPKFSAEQLKSDKDRDAQLENMKLQLRDLALYVEFTHACKYGDVGRIEDTLVPLIWMFKGNGKHKYAAHTFRHLINIRHIYPPGLVRTIRMNWLANPSGREDGFKGRDLIQELNNNILSNTHSGSGSNHTLSTIIKKSNLIELLANVKKNIGVSYSLSTRTTKHSRPDLTATVLKLAKYLIDISAHQFVPGRPSSQTTKNGWSDGFLRCITEYIPKSMPASSLLEPDTEAMELEEVDDPVENDIMNLELQDEDLDID